MVRRALLLAAGLGTRLRPLTDALPKCLAPVRGRPLLEYWLRALNAAGIEQVLVNTHHLAAVVRDYVAACPWAGKVRLVHEVELLGTGGTLLANADFCRGQRLLVAHADNLSCFDADAFLSAHDARPRVAELTMMTFATDTPSSCGVVTTDARGLVDGFYEKVDDPPGNRANAAVYIMEPAVFELAANLGNPRLDISTGLIPRLLPRIWTWHNGVYHCDIGTLSSWRKAQRDFPDVALPDDGRDAWNRVLEHSAPHAGPMIRRLLGAA